MDSQKINERLVGVGAQLKTKGWDSASINIFVSYLAIFDREPSPYDPMISYRPSIQASTRDRYGTPTSHEFVRGGDITSIESALETLETTADAMPTMKAEAARLEKIKAKLSDEERRSLGIR